MLWGGELVLRDGAVAGQVTSAAWGETIGVLRRAGLRSLDRRRRRQRRLGQGGRYEVNVGGQLVPDLVSLNALRPDERENPPISSSA